MQSDDIARIAAGLGRTQRATVLSLSRHWGKAANHQAAKRMWYRTDIPRLVDHKHMTDNCWCLTETGLAVRDHLLKSDAKEDRP